LSSLLGRGAGIEAMIYRTGMYFRDADEAFRWLDPEFASETDIEQFSGAWPDQFAEWQLWMKEKENEEDSMRENSGNGESVTREQLVSVVKQTVEIIARDSQPPIQWNVVDLNGKRPATLSEIAEKIADEIENS
jgi:hypothetical protein